MITETSKTKRKKIELVNHEKDARIIKKTTHKHTQNKTDRIKQTIKNKLKKQRIKKKICKKAKQKYSNDSLRLRVRTGGERLRNPIRRPSVGSSSIRGKPVRLASSAMSATDLSMSCCSNVSCEERGE